MNIEKKVVFDRWDICLALVDYFAKKTHDPGFTINANNIEFEHNVHGTISASVVGENFEE